MHEVDDWHHRTVWTPLAVTHFVRDFASFLIISHVHYCSISFVAQYNTVSTLRSLHGVWRNTMARTNTQEWGFQVPRTTL